jgi:hypothetical protein
MMLRALAALLAAAPLGAALACSCAPAAQALFLHTAPGKDLRQTAYLPANAIGVLFHAQPMLSIYRFDKAGTPVLDKLPPALEATHFTVTETGTGKRITPVVTRLQSAQLDALAPAPKSYLGMDGKDASAGVRRAAGVFRVGPEGGFVAGRSYRIRYQSKDGTAIETDVKLGPALKRAAADEFALRADGLPVRRMLSRPSGGGSCSDDAPALVQTLRFALPAAYEPYRAAMSFFVQQDSGKGYATTQYVPNICAQVPFGGSSSGALTELASAECGSTPKPARAKGFVGLLELDDKLVETAPLEIPFHKATGPSCDSFKRSDSLLEPVS